MGRFDTKADPIRSSFHPPEFLVTRVLLSLLHRGTPKTQHGGKDGFRLPFWNPGQFESRGGYAFNMKIGFAIDGETDRPNQLFEVSATLTLSSAKNLVIDVIQLSVAGDTNTHLRAPMKAGRRRCKPLIRPLK